MLVVVVIDRRSRCAFDFINGFHDAANSIATVVSTRVLSPRQAVVWAAFFNFVALVHLPARASRTRSARASSTSRVDRPTSTSSSRGLVGAIVWNLITWWCGLPSSARRTR